MSSPPQIISFTDHDSLGAYDDVSALSLPCKLITGIEFSTLYENTELHILGYGIDTDHTGLRQTVARVQSYRTERNRLMLSKLADMGIRIDAELFRDNSKGRLLMAQEMVRLGYVRDVKSAFQGYLDRGQPAYVSYDKITPNEAIQVIHSAGGKAIFAHPMRTKTSHPLPLIVKKLVAMGIDGLECYYSMYSCEERRRAIVLARRYGLKKTGGSDYHGEPRQIGVTIPDCEVRRLIVPDQA